jgi:thymidylate synthase ThyX
MPPKRQIYLLDPKKLSPETIAVTFAKTSRSALSFREISAELSDEKSSEFNEKWVVGYGHASVAEHAILHIALENISRRAVEILESNRLASYTEKSSRYQVFSADLFFTPPELINHPLEKIYIKSCRGLFRAYEDALHPLEKAAQEVFPRLNDESETGWQRRAHALALDICRYYLPASTLANVGMTINARALEHAICKMLSHPLREVRELGDEIKAIAKAKVPTLVKYASENPCLIDSYLAFSAVQKEPSGEVGQSNWLQVLKVDPQGETLVLAALLFRFGNRDFNEYLQMIKEMNSSQKTDLVKSLLGKLSPHDIPLRELEYAGITLAITLDQGAFGELKRHRMMTLTPQPFSTNYGYAIPKLISTSGLETGYRQLMEQVEETNQRIAAKINPEVAAYVLPHAFNRRIVIHTNMRAAYHLLKLRTAPGAHFAMRRVACRIAEEIQQIYPFFAPYFSSMANETSNGIEENYFTQTGTCA